MAGEETIGRATVQLGADGSKLGPEMAAAMAKAQGEFERANKQMEKAQAATAKAIQGHLDRINATKATDSMRMLEQAVGKLGGTAALNAGQLKRVTAEVNALAQAGAKVPASLKSLQTSTTGLDAAFRSLTSGGGMSGALAAIGPAGLTAAAGFGAITVATVAAAGAVGDLAKRGSQLSDLSAKAQIGVESLQRMEYAGSLVGVSLDAITGASLKLDRALVAAPEKFAALGLSASHLLDMNPEQRFEALSVALRALPDGPQRTSAAFDLLGKSAGEVLPFLTSNLAAAHEEATRLGIVLDEQTVRAADALDDSLTRLGHSADALKLQLAAIALGSADGAKGIDDLASGVGSLAAYISQNRTAFELLLKLVSKAAGLSGLGQLADLAGLAVGQVAPAVRTPIFSPGKIAPPSLDADLARIQARALEASKGAGSGDRKAAADAKKAADDHLKAIQSQNAAALALIKAREDETKAMQRTTDALAASSFAAEDRAKGPAAPGSLGSIGDAAQVARENGIRLAQAAQKSGLGLEQITHKLEGMGFSAEEAASIVDVHLAKQKEVNKSTTDWTSQLADLAVTFQGFGGILGAVGAAVVSLAGSFSLLKKMGTGADGKFSLGNLGASMKTFEGKMAVGGAAAGALGSLGQMAGGGNTVAGSALGGAAAGAQMGAIAGPWGMAAGALIGGAIGFFKGSKLKADAKEAGKILGKNVSVEQLKGLKEQAKAAGMEWKAFLKQQKKEEEKTAKIETRQELEAGLSQAAQFAQQLQARIDEGKFSERLKGAAEAMIGKVRDALLKSGMGMQLDASLAKSEAFQGAQGAAGDIAGILAGMREAGMVDAGLMGAAATSSQELFDQAVAAAVEAGKGPAEAQMAGFGAISQLLREQLNASIQSGDALDANTQKLLDEAKANGIEIMADPMIESLGVQKEQLGVLQQIAGQGGGGSRKQDDGSIPAAGGFGPMITPRLPGGLGPKIQTHPDEFAMVIPRSKMGPDGLLSAASGLYSRRGGGVSRGRGVSTTSINLTIAENPFQSAEGAARLRDHTLKTVERQTSKHLAALIAAGKA